MKEKKHYYLYTLFFLLILFHHEKSCAQDFSDTYTAKAGIKVKKPKGFELVVNYTKPFLEFSYITKDNRKVPLYPEIYLLNRDSSILILVEAFNYNKKREGPITPYWYDGNRFAYNHYASNVDVAFPVRFFSVKELAKHHVDWDWKVMYTRHFGEPNNFGEFKYHRTVIFNKNNLIYLPVTYLFKESSKHEMDKVVASTQDMFKSNNDFPRPSVSITELFNEHHAQIDNNLLAHSLSDHWLKGKIYNDLFYFWGENGAFRKDNMIISVKFPVNDKWPYFSDFYQDKIDTTVHRNKWDIANTDVRKFLSLATDVPYTCSAEETKSLHADEAYLFDFAHDAGDLYRGKYKNCRVLLMHKRNVGSIIVKYYYKPQDRKNIDNTIKKTWGSIAFRESAYFEQMSGRVFPY